MVRKYVPTGRPPGRPSFKKQLAEVAQESKNAVADFLLTSLKENDGKVPDAMQETVNESLDMVEHGLANAPKTSEEVLDRLKQLAIDNLPQVRSALARVRVTDPIDFIKAQFELYEYIIPKLAKVEQLGSVQHNHSVFVPVEARPAIPLVAGADGIHRPQD